MEAKISRVHREDNFSSPLIPAIILTPPEEVFDAVWDFLERAGFILRNWEDKEIVVYAEKSSKNEK